jgi:hypothetical protein
MAGFDPVVQQDIEYAVFFMDGRIKWGHEGWIFVQAPIQAAIGL